MPRLSIGGGLALVLACGFVNPIAKTPDGAMSRSRLRVGISSATLQQECWNASFCSVQLDMGHFDDAPHRVEIVSVRLLVGDTALGTVPTGETTRWRGGAYRAWDHVVEPSHNTKLSIAAFLAIMFASANHTRPFTDADIEEALRKRAVGVLAGAIDSADAFDRLWRERCAAESGDWRVWEEPAFLRTDPTELEHVHVASNQVRDVHMVHVLVEQLRDGERIFAVVGRSHVAVQEPALRALLPEAEFTGEFLHQTWVDR